MLMARVSAHAEVIGPLLPRATFEAGLEARWINREVYYGPEEADWKESGTDGIARWGITNLATISVEASRRSAHIEDEFEDVDFSYLVGGALQASLWRNEDVIISAAFQFTTTMFRVDEGPVRNITTSTASGQIIAQHTMSLRSADITAWGGPAYSLFYPNYESQLNGPGLKELYTETNWGAVVGVGALLWKHLDVTGYLLLVENPQPRVGLLYRF